MNEEKTLYDRLLEKFKNNKLFAYSLLFAVAIYYLTQLINSIAESYNHYWPKEENKHALRSESLDSSDLTKNNQEPERKSLDSIKLKKIIQNKMDSVLIDGTHLFNYGIISENAEVLISNSYNEIPIAYSIDNYIDLLKAKRKIIKHIVISKISVTNENKIDTILLEQIFY